MPRPTLSFLTPDLVEQVIAEGIAVLDNPGVRIHNNQALALLAEAGVRVDRSTRVAFFSEEIILQAVESAPREFWLYNLAGEPAVHYGGDKVHYTPGSSAVSLLEPETGKQRSPVTADLVRFVQLVETLPEYDAQSTAFVCRDVPEGISDLYRLYLALSYMHKPIVTGAFDKHTFWPMWEMLCAVAGGESALAQHPLAVFDVCPSPPLLWSDITCQNLVDCAQKGIPVELVSMPLAGAAAPVTLTGAVVQHTAESLSGLVIHQLTNSGAPVVWGGAPAAFDMRTGTTPMGDPVTWMIDCAYVEVGKRLNLPTHSYMGATDAKILDSQSGFESAGGLLLAALAGVNMVAGAGMIDFLRCQSFEKLVIDAEIIAAAKRLTRGIEPRQQPLALEQIRAAGHQAAYLANPHTQRWFRQELHQPSPLIDRGSLDAWTNQGSKTTLVRAQERVDQLLKIYHPSPLPEALRSELRKITQRAAEACGMSALPPLPEITPLKP